MSNLIPSTLRTSPAQPAPSSDASASPVLPQAVYTDCQTCRVTGTLTFAAVGLYALTVSRATAKTRAGRGAASLMGLGFLAVAAARWTAYTPPPSVDEAARPA